MTETKPIDWKRVIIIAPDGVRLRTGKGTSFNKIGHANEGEIFDVVEARRGFPFLWRALTWAAWDGAIMWAADINSQWMAEYTEPDAGVFRFEAWPTEDHNMTQPFGARPEYYQELTGGFLPAHEGTDIRAPFGSKIFTVADGTVTRITNKKSNGKDSAYGWFVVIEHIDGYSTLYAHNEPAFPVVIGQEVKAGDWIATSGNTGNSSGPHLHLTLKKAGYQMDGWPAGYVDPTDYLTAVLLG